VDHGFLSGLPPFAQVVLYGLAGLGVVGWMIVRYFKEADTARKVASNPGLLLAGDNESCKGLIMALERCSASGDRLDGTMRRVEDAVRDAREEMGKFRSTFINAQLQPRDEELNRLLREVAERLDRG
jgi:hypothetical protein